MGMKMVKASEADLKMAMDFWQALEALGQRWCPTMPAAIAQTGAEFEFEHFDSDNDAQCGRALRHLLEVAERGSMMRVVFGAAVMLDPRNKIVDPDADTIEHHPDRQALETVRQAVRDYHAALDQRQHGGVAQDAAMRKIEAAIGMPWVQGASLKPAAEAKQP